MNFTLTHGQNICQTKKHCNAKLESAMFFFVSKPLRRIRPNPKDPDWLFPHASRHAIENLEKYFAHFATSIKGGWKEAQARGVKTTVLPPSKNKIRWESVQPHLRPRCEEKFNRWMLTEKAKGIPGWPTAGKVRSILGCITRDARYCWSGRLRASLSLHSRRRRMWLAYLDWKAQNERRELLGTAPHKILEIGN
jgi:hypothetical protein